MVALKRYVQSTDGGKHWDKVGGGFPEEMSSYRYGHRPANPDVLYATVEGHGMYKSTDRGESWSKAVMRPR